MADHEVSAWGLLGAHAALPTQAFGFLECGLYIGDADVEDDVVVVAGSSADSAGNSRRAAARSGVGEAVVALLTSALLRAGHPVRSLVTHGGHALALDRADIHAVTAAFLDANLPR